MSPTAKDELQTIIVFLHCSLARLTDRELAATAAHLNNRLSRWIKAERPASAMLPAIVGEEAQFPCAKPHARTIPFRHH
jgi:hypothetical protein